MLFQSLFSTKFAGISFYMAKHVLSYQLKLIRMRVKLAILNHCAVPFLSRAAANLCWYYYTMYTIYVKFDLKFVLAKFIGQK